MILMFYWNRMIPGHALAAWLTTMVTLILFAWLVCFLVGKNKRNLKIALYKYETEYRFNSVESYGKGNKKPDWIRARCWYEDTKSV